MTIPFVVSVKQPSTVLLTVLLGCAPLGTADLRAADPQIEIMTTFSEGVAVIRSGTRYGFIRDDGTVLVAPRFSGASQFRNGVAIVHETRNGSLKDGFIDRQGRIVVVPEYVAVGIFSEGLASFVKGEERWYLDYSGRIRISGQFAALTEFSEGRAAVKVGDQWGYLNHWGEMVIPAQYDFADRFIQGVARVNIGGRQIATGVAGGRWLIIDRSGEVVKALD